MTPARRRTSLSASFADNPYVDAQGRTDAELYLMGVLDGSIVAGRRLKQLAEKMLPRIKHGYGKWRFDADAATRPVEFIERFLMIPSGKLGVPFILEPYERMIVELIFGFIDENEKRQIQYALVVMARKNGKALSLDTEIPTPDGWKLMRDIHPGDYVFGQDGKLSKVLIESEVFDKPMYLVTFEDGATVKASADHVWTVQTKGSRRNAKKYKTSGFMHENQRKYRDGGWFEVSTQEMADDESFTHSRKDGKGIEYKYRVPMSLPVEYPARDLPIDPYVFGAWLGDGTSSKPQISIGRQDEDEMVRNLSLRGHIITKANYPSCRCPLYDIDHHRRDGGRKNGEFKQKLIDLGVLNNKHIPDVYMHSSIHQRWDLLCGLMDTDGTCSKSGECEFTQKSDRIARQFVELCASLGIKASIHSKHASCNGVPAGIVYRVQFHTDKEHSCFHLKRKNDRLKNRLSPRMSCKSIINIEAIPNEPSKCIAIDNDSHLYLAGRQYTATHNTSFAAALELYVQLCDGEGAPQIYNAATSKAQASLAYGAVWRMVRQSPKLGKYLRKGVVTERAETGVICDQNMSYIVPLSKQSDHLDGLDVHMCVLDEMAAAEDRAIFDLVRQGTGAREQPLFLAITTNGFVRDGLFDAEHQYGYDWLEGKIDDDRFLPIFFEQDDRSEVFATTPDAEKLWLKSNPGLMHPAAGHINGGVKSLEYLRSQVLKAKNDSSYLPTLLTKDFNIAANSSTAFLSFEEAVNKTTYIFDPNEFRYCVVGIDAADRLDLNAATAIFMRPGDNHIYRKSMYWIAEEQITQNNNSMRGRDGGVPYAQYASGGILRVIPGNNVPRQVFLDWIQELADMGLYTRYVGYDPWRMENIIPDLKAMVGEANVEPVRQGPRTYSDPLKQMKADMRDGVIIDNNNSLDHMCNLNVAVKVDTNNNLTVVKKDGPTSRIDGFMALLDAYIALQRHKDDYLATIGWHE